jgi:hypothetical protein
MIEGLWHMQNLTVNAKIAIYTGSALISLWVKAQFSELSALGRQVLSVFMEWAR